MGNLKRRLERIERAIKEMPVTVGTGDIWTDLGFSPEQAAKNRALSVARMLDDGAWLASQYQDKSSNEIADLLGVGGSRVLRALHRHGIPIRSQCERNAKSSATHLARNRALRSKG